MERKFTILSSEHLLKTVIDKTGLGHLIDTQSLEALRVIIDSCNIEAGLSFMGQLSAMGYLRDLLETRLKLVSYWQEKPHIQDQEVLQPLFITGTPKSGSTFLHRLLALDIDNRVPRTWEVMFPLPPPMQVTFDSDYRISEADKRLRWLRLIYPSITRAHPIGAVIPQECGSILSYSFNSFTFLDMFLMPSYEAWLKSRDMLPAYEFHKSVLKHLQWLCRAERWVLKSSDHVHALPALLKAYPDANIVFLHRDPIKVLQSASSQMTLIKSLFSQSVNRRQLGIYESRILHEKTRKMMEFRDSHTHLEPRFMDICYLELARDPVAAVQAIYDCFGFALSPEARSRMNAFAASERNKRRWDKYSLSDFNLDPEEEDPRFDVYCDRFKVGREPL